MHYIHEWIELLFFFQASSLSIPDHTCWLERQRVSTRHHRSREYANHHHQEQIGRVVTSRVTPYSAIRLCPQYGLNMQRSFIFAYPSSVYLFFFFFLCFFYMNTVFSFLSVYLVILLPSGLFTQAIYNNINGGFVCFLLFVLLCK